MVYIYFTELELLLLCKVIVMHYMYGGLHVLTDHIIQFMLNGLHIFHRTGAAIVVDSRYALPSVFENSYFNPLCFLQYYNSTVPPSQWKQVCGYCTYTANNVVHGDASICYRCRWISQEIEHSLVLQSILVAYHFVHGIHIIHHILMHQIACGGPLCFIGMHLFT